MSVLLRYILRSIWSRPLRALLIIGTICISGAAMLASVSVSDAMIAVNTQLWRAEYGASDIVITASNGSASRFLDAFKVERYESATAYIVKKVSAVADYEQETVLVHGLTLDTYVQMMALTLSDQAGMPFQGNKVIVSQRFAASQGLAVGDMVDLVIGGRRCSFVIAALAGAQGVFANETLQSAAIVPYEKLQAVLGCLGRADTLYIGLAPRVAIGSLLLRLSTLYPNARVAEAYTTDHIRLQTNRTAVPFLFMSMLLCIMSVYVISVIFQNVVIERMPQMGIFRAMGASKRQTQLVMIMESVLYGLCGAVLSIGLGSLLLRLIMGQLFAQASFSDLVVSFAPWQVGASFVITVGISVAGSILAIRRQHGLSIVGLIKRQAPEAASRRGFRWSRGVLLMGGSLLTLLLVRAQDSLVLYVALIVLLLAGFLIVAEPLFTALAHLVKRMPLPGLWRIVSFAIQKQRAFWVAATIVTLIVATNMVIQAIAYSNSEGLVRHYDRFAYDMELTAGDLTRGKINTLSRVQGVEAVCANRYTGTTDVEGQDIAIYRIHGVDTERFNQFVRYRYTSTHDDPLAALNGGRNILLAQNLAQIYGVQEGDRIVLRIHTAASGIQSVPYTVIGFFDDALTKLGRYALIADAVFADDFKVQAYSALYIRTSDAQGTQEALERMYADQIFQVTTVEQLREAAWAESLAIITAMQWIAALSAVTGVLGMFFIMRLSFQTRRSELAIYGAMGLERSGIARMLLGEMLLVAAMGLGVGTLLGVVIGYLALPRLVHALQIAMEVLPHPAAPALACALGLGVCVSSGLLGIGRLRRMTWLEGLRSE